jgi:hypothetical protein
VKRPPSAGSELTCPFFTNCPPANEKEKTDALQGGQVVKATLDHRREATKVSSRGSPAR